MRLRAALVALLVVGGAFAQEVPPLTGRVVDQAGILTPEETARLDSALARIEAETSVQIAVLTVPRLETPIEDFSIRVAEAWGIGRAETDNGALVVVSIEDRRSRLEVGYGLEPMLPDGVAGRILRDELSPAFQAGEYALGFERTALRIAATAIGEFEAPAPRPERRRRGVGGLWMLLLLVGAQVLGWIGNAARPWVAGAAGGGAALLLGLLLAGPLALLFFVPVGFLAGLAATGMTRAAASRTGSSWGYGGPVMMGRSGFGSGFGGGFGGGGGGFGGGGASGSW